jgi:hypothetical protein
LPAQDGQTALHKAAEYNQPASLTALLQNGVTANVADKVPWVSEMAGSPFCSFF